MAVGTVIDGVAFGTVIAGVFESELPAPLPATVDEKAPAGATFGITTPAWFAPVKDNAVK